MATLHELEALECDGRLKPHVHGANGWSSISTSSDPTYYNGARPASNALPIFWWRMFGTNFNRKSTNPNTDSGRWACETRLPSSDTIFFAAFPASMKLWSGCFTKWVNENKAARGHDTAAVAVGRGICDSDQDRNARPSACEN